MPERILVVDDEPIMRDFLCESLERMDRGYTVEAVSNGAEALGKLNTASYDLVVTDMVMPDLSGIELLREVQSTASGCDVILMTAYGTINNAVEAMQLGAVDFLTKPFTIEKMEEVIKRALEQHRAHVTEVDKSEPLKTIVSNFEGIVGTSPSMQRTFELLRMVAPSKATVLITGESGTGKELIARAIHRHSSRREGPFIKLNCAALPEHLVESELFGYEKGAFTGAVRQHKGKFEMAHNGTLLLDEISEMPLSLQAKLLRVLQEREIERLGGSGTIPIDTRIIATTNRNLQEDVRKKRFREDLYYRLNVIPIHLPPLRERPSDIPMITQFFIEKYNRENEKTVTGVTEEAALQLRAYSWPGNIRELENQIERAVLLCPDQRIQSEHLFPGRAAMTMDTAAGDAVPSSSPMPMKEYEKSLILKTLRHFEGNRMKTADALQISVRTLRNKLRDYRASGDFPG